MLFSSSTKKITMFLLIFSLILSLLLPSQVYADDIDPDDSIDHKILVYCDEEDTEFADTSECVYAHYGGDQNKIRLEQLCNAEDEEKGTGFYRCLDRELLAQTIELMDKFRPSSGDDNDGNDDNDNRDDSDSEYYNDTQCFTNYGGIRQEKLCPRDAVYPNDNPPATDKCYASTTFESVGGREVYEESSCDVSTFTNSLYGQYAEEEEGGPLTCEEAVNDAIGLMACPVLGFLEDAATLFFNFADGLLSVDAQAIGENDSLRAAWGFFRVVATSMLIVIGLVMVFSQAMGGNV